MCKLLCVAATVACLSTANAFAPALGLRAPSHYLSVNKGCTASAARRTWTSMSTVETVEADSGVEPADVASPAPASDVLADLDELDSFMGIDTQYEADLQPRQRYINKLAGQAALRRWRRDENDTGSPGVQIAVLTERIVYLTKHMQQHPHDYHSRRGLLTLVSKRRKNLNYYFRRDPDSCVNLCKTLGIRFRPKSKVRGREARYAAYKNTKSKVGMKMRTEMINKEKEEEAAAAAAAELAAKQQADA
ncbi:unnamed protein product [Discosporangium mesarthrocarpum]